MARAGYCETGYSGIAPKCVLKTPIKNLCKKSCKVCGTDFSFLQVLGRGYFHCNTNSLNFSYSIGAPSEYPIAGFNRLCSETGFERIVGLSRCQMVAQMMNKTFSVAKTWKEYPNGCYIFSDNRVYFNHHLTGQSNELACPICYIPGSSGIYIQSLLKIESKCIKLNVFTL